MKTFFKLSYVAFSHFNIIFWQLHLKTETKVFILNLQSLEDVKLGKLWVKKNWPNKLLPQKKKLGKKSGEKVKEKVRKKVKTKVKKLDFLENKLKKIWRKKRDAGTVKTRNCE